ncbi:MAG: transglycosylase SLT domain-containing protein [Thermoleophilia bacterium]|nr:transglycosylase SLT domain-containing protein [Thermoleophilia bacterium]
MLQSLVQTISTLVQALQAQLGAGGNSAAAQADAGANTLGGGDTAAQTPGGCGCGGAAGAVAGVKQDAPPLPETGGAAGAPTPTEQQPERKKQEAKKNEAPKLASAPAPAGGGGNAPPRDTKDIGKIKDYINVAAQAYGTNARVLTNIAEKESTFNADAWNKTDSNARAGHPSKGMFQFIKSTFDGFAPKAKAANPAAWEGLGALDWMDWRQQALATAWGIENGHAGDWATFGAAKAAA